MIFIRINFLKLVILFVTSLVHPIFAQSDYEIVREFKQKFKQLQESINSANNMGKLNSVVADIDRFRNEYVDKKELLDKSLYPDNFDKMFEKLDMAFVIRNQDFTTIDVLQIENLEMKEQIIALNNRNTELINQIQELEYVNKKNAKEIA